KFVVLKVEGQAHQQRLLNTVYGPEDVDDNAKPQDFARWVKYTTENQDEETARQVDIRSLKQGTTAAAIKGALSIWGEIQHVRLWPQRGKYLGGSTAATVYFTTEEPVIKMTEKEETMVF
ncbi:hypothetical protein BGZ58_006551, partial [Dissophora ornata]